MYYTHYAHDLYYCKYCDKNLKYLSHHLHFTTNIHKKNFIKFFFFLWRSKINKPKKYIITFD